MSERIRIDEDVVARELAGEAMLLDLETGTYFGLNEAGSRIWRLLEEHGSRESVVAALLEEYDVEEDRLRREVDALIADLSERGLVQVEIAETGGHAERTNG